MKRTVLLAAASMCMTAFCGKDVKTDLPYHPADGIRDVARANAFGNEGKWKEGREFISGLRASVASRKANLEEKQSVDMAEFAFLRHDLAKNRERCIECLENVYRSGAGSFWGWAAWSFLGGLGRELPMPPKDPLRGLGEFGDGVVNLVPLELKPGSGASGGGTGLSAAKLLAEAAEEGGGASGAAAALSRGSPFRKSVLRTRLVETCGEETIDAILSSGEGAGLFLRLWNDGETLENFMLSGPAFDAPRALKTLLTLWLNDTRERWSETPLGAKATIAVALNARRDDNMAETVRHWAAYRRIGMTGRFVDSTAARDCREWRFIVRFPSDPADTLYLNTVRKFPTRYPRNVGLGAVPYRRENCFGTSKWAKNDEYLRPWTASGWPRQYLRTRVGGVCTEQSMWAALCANAHGLMAERAGQPGHCSWLSRDEKRRWRVISSIKPYTQGVFSLWGRGFQYIQASELAFADMERYGVSELKRFMAAHAEKSGDAALAGKLFREAALESPYNVPAWQDLAAWMKKSGASADAWKRYLAELVSSAPEGRLATWDLVHGALDALASSKTGRSALLEETEKAFKALPQPRSGIAEEMNFVKDAVKRSLARFKGDNAAQMKILFSAMEACRESPAYLPQICGFAMKRYAGDPGRLDSFFKHAAGVIGAGAGDGPKSAGFWRSMFSASGCTGNRAIFRMLAGLRNEYDPPAGACVPPENDFGRPLVSGDALVTASSLGRKAAVEDLPRVSDATPYNPRRKGLLSTKDENAPWARVDLAGEAVVYGVSASGECSGLSVWTAGEDGVWREAPGVTSDGKSLRADFTGAPARASSVRVGMKKGKGVLRLDKVLVYGEKLY